MYIPSHFQGPEPEALRTLMGEYPFATLVTEIEGSFDATHVPCLIDAGGGELGTIRFHLARANPAVGALADRECLLIFSGPHTYISPDWYETADQVPTWNYLAVHAYGRAAAVDDAGLCALLDELSATEEGHLSKFPWRPEKLPAERYARMRTAIVGFEMPVQELQGKWKLSQNRSTRDRAAVIERLRELGRPDQLEVANRMADLTSCPEP